MNVKEIIAKADRGEGLTVEEIKVYRKAVPAHHHVYGKYGTLALKYLEEHNVGKLWEIENLPEYLHGIDRQADELYESMYARLKGRAVQKDGRFYGRLSPPDGNQAAYRGRDTQRTCVC